ncbi:MAG: phosphoglycerate dehydrogenase, partial [Christensenellaceae bacterium]|nr:phosphoglycerate dehydrogenase [Christensenellaceae bacterium]
RALLESFADEVVYNDLGRPLQPEEILERLDGVDGYLAGVDYITAEVIEKAPASLKVISRYGAGVDRVDIPAATKKGIKVTFTPGTNSVAVCELAFSLMLSAARSIPRLDRAVHGGEWPRIQGIELKGKTLGIVGLGAIGKNLATRAQAFGMKVAAYDPYLDEAFVKEHGIEAGTLEEVCKQANFLSLHVPLMDSTRHMINKEIIDSMPDRAIIINTARGGIIDEEALAEALESGKIAAAALDAFEQEPVVDSPLLKFDNVIMTPHTGAHTGESVQAMGALAAKNVIDVLTGKECPYILNK